MCGIAGITGIDAPEGREVIQRMLRTLLHRGPDGEGIFADSQVALGCRRLAVVDLVAGHQPMSAAEGQIQLVLNGEIYNAQELRQQLAARGMTFKTHSDTEVLLGAYLLDGQGCVHSLRGMFSFAIWDGIQQQLILVRDRLGIKPLYYAVTPDGKLAFASEIKAILQVPGCAVEIDPVALDQYLTLGYIPSPRTLFAGISKLPPGHKMIWRRNIQTPKPEPYWGLPFRSDSRPIRIAEGTHRLLELLKETVRLHLIADVPVGCMLSGGIDSSLIAALMQHLGCDPLETFTAQFPEADFDESLWALRVAQRLRARSHMVLITADDLALLPQLVWSMDEPIADPSALAVFKICQLANQDVTVLLTGEGADELFGGYRRYALHGWAERLRQLPPVIERRVITTLLAVCRGIPRAMEVLDPLKNPSHDHRSRDLAWNTLFSHGQRQRLYTPSMAKRVTADSTRELLNHYEVGGRDFLAEICARDLRTWLVDDILMKTDRMSMWASVEARVPFLDHKVVEFALQLPSNLKVRPPNTKVLLKNVARRFLPPQVVFRRKHAFNVSVGTWICQNQSPWVSEILLNSRLAERGILQRSTLQQMVEEHVGGRKDHSRRLWALLCLEMWCRLFLDREPADSPRPFPPLQRRTHANRLRQKRRAPIVLATPEPLKHRGGIQMLLGQLAETWRATDSLELIAPRSHRLKLKFLWQAKRQLADLIRQGRCRAVLCGHWTVGSLGWWAKRRHGIPYAVWAYGLEVMDTRWQVLQQQIFTHASSVFTCSLYTKQLVHQRFGLPEHEVVGVWPGVDSDRFGSGDSNSVRQRLNLSQRPVLLTVSRLNRLQRYKGIDTTLKALPAVLRQAPGTVYLIVGQQEDDTEYLQRLASRLGVTHHVRFVGEVLGSLLPNYYAACDLFVMPTRTEVAPRGVLAEGFGMTFLEAAAAGKPAIGGRSGGVPEAIVEGVTGLLIDPLDPDALSENIIQLLSDRELSLRLGTQARLRAASDFRWERVVRQVQTHLESLNR